MPGLIEYVGAPFNGPFAVNAQLANVAAGAANIPYEGPWVPFGWVKQATVDLEGVNTGAVVSILGTDQINPVNTLIGTLGGSITATNTITLVFTPGNAPSFSVPYVVVGGDTTNTILAGHIAAAINASASAQALGIVATGVGGTVVTTWPSVAPGQSPSSIQQPSSPPPSTTLGISYTAGGNTETIAFTNGTDGISLTGALATATPGPLTVTPLPVRWIKARVTALTTGTAIVNVSVVA